MGVFLAISNRSRSPVTKTSALLSIAAARIQRSSASRTATADGVVGVHFAVSNYAWGHHTVEFYVGGTAVRRTGSGETIAPSFVLPMSG